MRRSGSVHVGRGTLRSVPAFLRFAAAGATGYVVNLAVYGAAVHGARLEYRAAAVLAYVVAVATTYALNRRFTFRSAAGASLSGEASRYLLVSLVAFGVNLGVLQGLVEIGDVPALLAQALAIAVAAPVNYAGQRWWTFAPPGRAS